MAAVTRAVALEVSIMRNVHVNTALKAIAAAGLLLSAGAFAQAFDTATAGPERRVEGQTIVSQALPKATVKIATPFQFVGTQQVNLYGNAQAEQYLFVKVGRHGIVDRFFWIQFEHFLPTNKLTYSYDSKRAAQIGNLPFVYDVRSWPNYATVHASYPASDGAAIERLLAKHDLSLPERAVQVRMFHLPSADHRAELMIIYGEALSPHSSVPVREGGVDLDVESAASAQKFLDHARHGLIIQAQ